MWQDKSVIGIFSRSETSYLSIDCIQSCHACINPIHIYRFAFKIYLETSNVYYIGEAVYLPISLVVANVILSCHPLDYLWCSDVPVTMRIIGLTSNSFNAKNGKYVGSILSYIPLCHSVCITIRMKLWRLKHDIKSWRFFKVYNFLNETFFCIMIKNSL